MNRATIRTKDGTPILVCSACELRFNGCEIGNCRRRLIRLLAEREEGAGWVSVADGLPEEKGGYIVSTNKGGILLAHWYGDKWGGGYAAKHITHWMPKPKAPVEV
jgi:hypothetical protein